MRVLVISDTHGAAYNLINILEKTDNIDYLIFLGDGIREVENVLKTYPEIKFLKVLGNCDMDPFNLYKESDYVEIAGKKIFFCHGHKFYVKSGLGALCDTARKMNADILLFGHTHLPHLKYEDGLYIINPGSLSKSRTGKNSYALIEITTSGILPNIVEV